MRRGIVLGATIMVLLAVAAHHAAEALVVSDPLPRRADAIVVLAGSPIDRVLETTTVYATGIADQILVTREERPKALDTLAARGVVVPESSEVMVDLLVQLGVPSAAIAVLPERTNSTLAEARVLAAWACEHDAAALVVVTSPSHTRRARMIFRTALGPSATVSVRPAGAAGFDTAAWWRDRRTAKTVLLEWQKLLAYLLLDQWRLEPCRVSVTRR